MQKPWFMISAGALLLCCACSDDTDKNPGGADSRRCTLVGCGNNLTVMVKSAAGAVIKRHHGSVTLEGSSGTFACTGSGGGTSKGPCFCSLDGALSCTSLKGGDLEIEVISDEAKEKYKGVLKPAYTFTYPNGQYCPPKCYKADEAVTLAAY